MISRNNKTDNIQFRKTQGWLVQGIWSHRCNKLLFKRRIMLEKTESMTPSTSSMASSVTSIIFDTAWFRSDFARNVISLSRPEHTTVAFAEDVFARWIIIAHGSAIVWLKEIISSSCNFWFTQQQVVSLVQLPWDISSGINTVLVTTKRQFTSIQELLMPSKTRW